MGQKIYGPKADTTQNHRTRRGLNSIRPWLPPFDVCSHVNDADLEDEPNLSQDLTRVKLGVKTFLWLQIGHIRRFSDAAPRPFRVRVSSSISRSFLSFWIMEMELLAEYPHAHMDRRPRKRARLGWDVPEAPKVIVFLDPFLFFLFSSSFVFFSVRSTKSGGFLCRSIIFNQVWVVYVC